jgi:hypothetical protein
VANRKTIVKSYIKNFIHKMKNIFFLVVGFTFSAAQSQEITDALRYSQDNLNGTARFRAMGCIWRSWWRLIIFEC